MRQGWPGSDANEIVGQAVMSSGKAASEKALNGEMPGALRASSLLNREIALLLVFYYQKQGHV